MFDDHAFGPAGCAGGVDDVRGVGAADIDVRPAAVIARPVQAVWIETKSARLRSPAGGGVVHKDVLRARVVEH